MTWAIAWKLARPFLPYIGAVLALGAAVWWVYDAGQDSRDGEVREITAARDTARADADRAEAWRDQFKADYAASQADALALAKSLQDIQSGTDNRKAQIRAMAHEGASNDCRVPARVIRLRNEGLAEWKAAAIGGSTGDDAVQPAASITRD